MKNSDRIAGYMQALMDLTEYHQAFSAQLTDHPHLMQQLNFYHEQFMTIANRVMNEQSDNFDTKH